MITENLYILGFRPINARGEFECRQVVFWGTGTKRLGTPALEEYITLRIREFTFYAHFLVPVNSITNFVYVNA